MSNLPIIPDERIEDLIGFEHRHQADLILFMAGNQFMVMPELLQAFKAQYPECDKIFCETLPPGLEFKQIIEGGALFRGEVLTGEPDCFTSVAESSMEELANRGRIEGYRPYLKNRLVIMVREGNPKGIKGVQDLARDDVVVSQPGPMEHIAAFIEEMYRAAGGEELLERILKEKQAAGTTIVTKVHHRETPKRILEGSADCGPCWATEAIHAKKSGLALDMVEVGPGLDQSDKVKYFVTVLKGAPHPEAARHFFDFLFSDVARAIYSAHGFLPFDG